MPHAAAFGAAAGGIALDQVQLAAFHVAAGAIAELAGQAAGGQGPLAFADQGAGLAGALAGLGRQQPLLHDDLGRLGVLFEEAAQEVAHRRVDDSFHLAVAQLGLGLALELRLGHAQRDHGREPFAEVVAAGNQVLEEPFLLAVGVEGAGDGARLKPETCVPPSLVWMLLTKEWTFSVNSAEYCMAISMPTSSNIAGDVDDFGMGRLAGPVEVLDELQHAALVVERFALRRCDRRGRRS